MAERKRWDKQADFHPSSGSSSSSDAKADPVLTKQLQYIKVLEERNRVKKRLAAASKRNDRLQEREEAFVTAFNVPARAAQAASLSSRTSRSSTSVLPTKFPGKREEAKLSKCRSAPSTTLNFAAGGGDDEKEKDQNRARRAKWSRPQAPMGVTVDHEDGVPLFRLTTHGEEDASELKGAGSDEEDEEESYLEESFEEFEEDEDERRDSRRVPVEELVIDELDGDVERDDEDAPVDLSKTTKELFGIIQHLSRSKQRALVDVLHQFQASEQEEKDVEVLQSSIGDPAIWKDITSALHPSPSVTASPATARSSGTSTVDALGDHPTVAPLRNVLEEQLRWEDEYTNEMKERRARERQEKQRILKEAEERRAKMMKQLEDEEREIEHLMEVKRLERLAKLRALQDEAVAAAPSIGAWSLETLSSARMDAKTDLDSSTGSAASTERKSQERKRRETTRDGSQVDEVLYIADAKSTARAPTSSTRSELTRLKDLPGSKTRREPTTVVPRLNLDFNVGTATSSERHEIQVKLLSTWGQTRAVGLTQIYVYDLNGEELSIEMETLRLYDQPTGRPLPKTNDMVRGLQRLFNGVVQTNTEKEMWLGRLGDSGVLLVQFEVSSTPSKLCVWNYNSKTHTACTRDIEVLVSGKSVWTGSLPETLGDEDDNPCTWIDLLDTARKSSRTARLEESSLSTDRSDAKLFARGADSLRPEQQSTVQVNEFSSEKATAGTPLWLAGVATASSSTERLPVTSRSGTVLDPWIADEKPASGSITSRRRQGKPLCSARSATSDVKYAATRDVSDVKAYSSQPTEEPAENKPRYQHLVAAPALASLSSWDSLEKFSKTNRSRLAQPTDTAETAAYGTESSFERSEANAKAPYTRTSFTASALLTELRQGSNVPNFASVSPSLYPEVQKYSAPEPVLTDSRPPTTREGGHHDSIADIPVLPSGKWLQIEILSTWGDPYYVGLNGVEIFDHRGELVHFQDPETQVTACPESINVLEENADDPRVPKNLVDGVNFTCDDFHMWLAPYTPGQAHYVLLAMDASVSVSMVRIWNYNKSRTHTGRGVREACLILYNSAPTKLMSGSESKLIADSGESGSVIFEGEVRQAPGLVGADSMESSNEVILFTQEAAILEAIEANDEALRTIAREQEREDEETREIVDSVHRSMELRRPRTSDAGSRAVEKSPKNQENNDEDRYQPRLGRDGRPMTTATSSLTSRDTRLRTSIDLWVAEEPQQRSPDAAKASERLSKREEEYDLNSGDNLPRGRRLTLQLRSTWGDRNYIGLTQVEVLVGSRGTPIPLDTGNVDATPRDLASLGYIGDPRTLDKLIDGEVTTCDDTHMWLVPFEVGVVPEVRIELKAAQYLYGLRVWNYNKSPEDTYRGVKQLVVMLDGVVISPKDTGFLIRKAPGTADFNFGQLLRFSEDGESPSKVPSYSERVRYPFSTRAYKTPIVRQDYEAPLYPQGFLLKIVCWATWGDPYYLGLNGLELFDFSGARVSEKPAIVTAVPFSVSELDNLSGRQQDTRTPDNLVSGLDKNTWGAHDAWLAPLASSIGNQQGNIVYVGFDTPVVLSMIKFWNYSKTPERGVKDVDIYLDDLHLFSGTLKKAPMADANGASRGFGKMHKVTEQFGQPVLFSASQAQVDAEKRNVHYCGVEEQDVLGINEGQVMQESRAMYRKPDPGAEGVVVDLDLRPMTAVCRQ
ncbi:hypothetical protein PHYPSEUDO_010099 [Phytophthora pseudosyringae]|uniref:KATNIP domain-containing protein n=1 Tax=Phytophthora pseudosyringae TaxID=221518 RepID=A0A8T1VE67_9STRA|nr:hypothetical protein PHYPSEUDO_010099 [Phytophthora pseudosyringae]